MGKLPLDDPRWVSIEAAIELRTRQTGDLKSAVRDLTEAMAGGELRSQRRYIVRPSRPTDVTLVKEELEPAFWKSHVIDAHRTVFGLSVFIFRGTPQRGVMDRVEGGFSIWMPDFDRLYSGEPRRAIEDDDSDDPPVKPGKKPHGDWPTLIAQWLIAVAADDRKRLQNVDALVVEANNFLRNRIKWAPKDDKALRKKIRELLKLIRR